MHDTGRLDADVLIIGNVPDSKDYERGRPYSTWTSQVFRNVLAVLGTKTYYLTCAHKVPMRKVESLFTVPSKIPDLSIDLMHDKKVSERCWKDKERLLSLISRIKPKIVLLLGVYPLFLFTGETKANDYRGSHFEIGDVDFVTSLDPYVLEKRLDWVNLVKNDFARAVKYIDNGIPKPNYNFEIFPTFDRIMEVFDEFEYRCDNEEKVVTGSDIETTPSMGSLDCIGFTLSPTHAICIPFVDNNMPERCKFDADEEAHIFWRMKELFKRPNFKVYGQNWMYDAMWLALWGGITTNVETDTMIAHHTLFPHLKKDLGLLSSLYCKYHSYWKDERQGKAIATKAMERIQWEYNCKDCLITYEIGDYLTHRLIPKYGMEKVNERQQALFNPVLYAMLEGHKLDLELRKKIFTYLEDTSTQFLDDIKYLLEHDINIASPKQMKEMFYEVLQQPENYTGRGPNRRVSCDEQALIKIGKKEPLLAPVTDRISDIRSMKKTMDGCLSCSLSPDNRFRANFNIPGTETYRFASGSDAFGDGVNAQNITSGGELKVSKIENPRTVFIPDDGYLYWAVDLDRADAQVVAWEANDEPLKKAFREGVDIHTQNAIDIFGTCDKDKRKKAKASVHAMNYTVRARTLAIALGVPIAYAQQIIDKWFEKHPAIEEWHGRVERNIIEKGYVQNAFGYRCYFYGRIESILAKAVAWAPQSTVANVTNQAFINIFNQLYKYCRVRFQVHDELTGVINKKNLEYTLPILRNCFNIAIPYKDPLTIPVGLSISEKSWGDKREIAESDLDMDKEILEMWNQEIII